ncbi:anthranilate phosphoribosyltransferase [Verrucomicrobium sp. GAS474]|uniref:anthranilate phosphoribosyltransferase n=1 Tax=Verrucomicrobium sp. GAS474 TaxID=1882831 RepID=UPI0008797E50|nr:anthranilate phosphoribosyltransferase [Verrucomicrobium sp. GAS474]SDU01028.1 anthranilate phosphoribosyltransferase [Verrucomicrobium sp. GAS474]
MSAGFSREPLLSDLATALRAGRELTGPEVAAAAEALLSPPVEGGDEAKKAFLRALTDKGETPAELAAFAAALLPRALPLPAFRETAALLDCCGTGGGGLPLFNVSTAALFVLAAAGVPVVKHGNRGVTKPSGSSDVIDALGLGRLLELSPDEVGTSLERLGFAYLHAPRYHSTFAVLGAVRKELALEGRRTIFNLLGPLLNPARPGCRLVGVFREEHVPLYAEALRLAGCARYAVVRGCVGGTPIGEASPTGENLIGMSEGVVPGVVRDFFLQFASAPTAEALKPFFIASARESAAWIEALLTPIPQRPAAEVEKSVLARSLIVANAGLALVVAGRAKNAGEGQAIARKTIDDGGALAKLAAARAF